MKRYLYACFTLLSIGTIVLDRLTKNWVVSYWDLHHLIVGKDSIPAIGNTVWITYARNTGGAFGLFDQFSFIFIMMGVLIPVLIMVFFKTLLEKGSGWVIAAAFIFGGAIGNFIDRILVGYVVDFINFQFWPIFNVADIAISVGIGILFICIVREGHECPGDGNRETEIAGSETGEGTETA